MKLIIDIPDGYNLDDIKNGSIACGRILKAVKNGKPYEERPTGHWIEEPSRLPHCSVCGTYSDDADREDGGFYCTHCGSRMIEVQDEDQ